MSIGNSVLCVGIYCSIVFDRIRLQLFGLFQVVILVRLKCSVGRCLCVVVIMFVDVLILWIVVFGVCVISVFVELFGLQLILIVVWIGVFGMVVSRLCIGCVCLFLNCMYWVVY